MAAVLPWDLGVVTPRDSSGKVRIWDERIRPLPANIRLYSSTDDALRDGVWDWVLTHNAQDLLDVRDVPLPKVFLVHGTLSGRIVQDRAPIDRAAYLRNLRMLLEANGARVVYISNLKRDDWGIPGEVIRTCVDPASYCGYRGERRAILQVCNHLRERGEILGWEAHQAVCRDLPKLVLGRNRGLPESRIADDWEDLREQYRSHRLYLHTAIYPYEDGYNLAMLEAMATGMPVATVYHPTSPIEDGVQGVVGRTPDELRARVLWLLDNRDEAIRMGGAARMRLKEQFPVASFRDGWLTLAAVMARGSDNPSRASR